jgi:peptidoglycan/xylan/chitin deacetylase (PgdA/CDA1 family)
MEQTSKLRVVQCWDDGVESDAALTELLRRHEAKASFNLNAGLCDNPSESEWTYRDSVLVRRLPWAALHDVYDGFTIANHSLTHPMPLDASPQQWTIEVRDGRSRLQDHFGQPVLGFAYPFGRHDAATATAVRAAGHVYGRTVGVRVGSLGAAPDPWVVPPDCHFNDSDFWARYEAAKSSPDAVFWFWGHSYELTDEAAWRELEHKVASITSDPGAQWCDLPDLFTE